MEHISSAILLPQGNKSNSMFLLNRKLCLLTFTTHMQQDTKDGLDDSVFHEALESDKKNVHV